MKKIFFIFYYENKIILLTNYEKKSKTRKRHSVNIYYKDILKIENKILPAPRTNPATFQNGVNKDGRTLYLLTSSSNLALCSFSCSHISLIFGP